jgi:hypothetical protein
MKMRRRKTIKIELIGGLGNQLFQFFAAKYLADKKNCDLVLRSNRIGLLESDHGFHLPNLVETESITSEKLFFPNFMAHISKILEKVERRLFPETFVHKIFKTHNSGVIGFDPKIEDLSPSITLRGYFQTYRYFTSNSEYKEMVRLRNPSRWCKEMQVRIEGCNSISIHVRCGDYASLKQSFGLLDETYYKCAVSVAEKYTTNPTYFIFSDDISWARGVLKFLPVSKTFYVTPPPESNPSESMYLMSLSDCLVGANSTFSYWSGLLMSGGSTVITPDKWFRNLEDPNDLRPPDWITSKSSWVD